MDELTHIKKALEAKGITVDMTSVESPKIWTKGDRPTECVCGGEGYYLIHWADEMGDDQTAYTPCPCRTGGVSVNVSNDRKWYLFGNTGLPSPARKNNFETMDTSQPQTKRMVEAAMQFVSEQTSYFFSEAYRKGDPSSTRPWLAIFGRRGTGKTHVCAAICRAFIEHGLQPTYWYVSDLMDELRKAQFVKDEGENYWSKLDEVKDAAILILDDIRLENSSSWTDEQLDKIIDYRYRHEKTTVVTTNSSIAKDDGEEEELPPRVADRLRDNAICIRVKNEAQSYRPHNKRG